MKIIKLTFICLFLLTFHYNLFSQAQIDINIKGLNDSVFYLIKYKSDKTHAIIDTSSISQKKKSFTNNTLYEEGIYVLADSKQQPVFEILIGIDQTFSIHIDELMDNKTYKVKGSKETSAYFKVIAMTTHYNLYIDALRSEINKNPNNKNKIDSISDILLDYQENMLSKDENSFLNTYIKCIEKIYIPDSLRDKKSRKDAYIVDHYFDEIPLCDSRILNSRLLKHKLDDYFNNYIFYLDSESICKHIDALINKVNDCKEVRDYILWYLYSHYFTPENIKHESVFIYIVDNYFSRLDIENLSDNLRKDIIERADVLRNIIIGANAPIISYNDENDSIISLNDIVDKNIVIFFFKADCQKCIKEKRILNLIKSRHKDLEVITIDITDETIYSDIIHQYDIMTSPTLFLLDKNKKIIAKNIKAEDIEFYLIRVN